MAPRVALCCVYRVVQGEPSNPGHGLGIVVVRWFVRGSFVCRGCCGVGGVVVVIVVTVVRGVVC